MDKIIGWLISVLVFVVSVILYQTLKTSSPPFDHVSTRIIIAPSYEALNLKQEIIVNVSNQKTYTFETLLEQKETKSVLRLPDIVITLPKGKQTISRSALLPNDIRKTTWCMTTKVRWEPTLSVLTHEAHIDTQCLDVE